MSLKLLRILTVVAPAIFIGLFEWGRHTVFIETGPMLIGNLTVIAAVTIAAFFFSRFIFGVIEKTQKDNLRQNRELTAMNSVAVAVGQSLDLEVILYRALDKIVEVAAADSGEILLLDKKNQKVTRQVHAGLFPEAFQGKIGINSQEASYTGLILSGQPVVVPDISQDSGLVGSMLTQRGFRSFAGVPLRSGANIVGAIEVYSLAPQHFGHEGTRLLTNIGFQIVLAIENARLHEEVQLLAAAEERGRIAREMHDNIAQVLSYVGTKSQAARQFISTGQIEDAKAQLLQLEGVSQNLYDDVREAILGLRSIISAEKDAVSVLKEYVLHFNQMTNIKTDMEIRDNSILSLSAASQLQVIRIIQEAMSNVRKHAKASHAHVRIYARDNQLEITVEDNGQGFDVSDIKRDGWPHFGLQTMKERADSTGGTLELISTVGEGTKVVLSVPTNTRADHESVVG